MAEQFLLVFSNYKIIPPIQMHDLLSNLHHKALYYRIHRQIKPESRSSRAQCYRTKTTVPLMYTPH